MIDWRVYYSDGSTFDSSQGTPDDAPAFGVQEILQLADDGRIRDVVTGADFYLYCEDGKWTGSDLVGLIERLANRIPFSGTLIGRWEPVDVYQAILRTAEEDTDFPQATS
jgi:hypothetical protein